MRYEWNSIDYLVIILDTSTGQFSGIFGLTPCNTFSGISNEPVDGYILSISVSVLCIHQSIYHVIVQCTQIKDMIEKLYTSALSVQTGLMVIVSGAMYPSDPILTCVRVSDWGLDMDKSAINAVLSSLI